MENSSQPQLQQPPQSVLDPTCHFCRLDIVCIVGGVLVIIIGFANLIELLEIPNHVIGPWSNVTDTETKIKNCTEGLSYEYILENEGGVAVPVNDVEEKMAERCKIIIDGAFPVVIAFTVVAACAGIVLIGGAMADVGLLGLVAAALLFLAVLLYTTQVVLVYIFIPGKELFLYSYLRDKKLVLRLWGVARAKEIFCLIGVAILFLYLFMCALKVYCLSRYPKVKVVPEPPPPPPPNPKAPPPESSSSSSSSDSPPDPRSPTPPPQAGHAPPPHGQMPYNDRSRDRRRARIYRRKRRHRRRRRPRPKSRSRSRRYYSRSRSRSRRKHRYR